MTISDISRIEIKGNCFIEDTELKIFESIDQNDYKKIINNSVAIVYCKNGEGKKTISNKINKLSKEETQEYFLIMMKQMKNEEKKLINMKKKIIYKLLS